jgi:3-methyladenine DNA glycosylase AlkD
MPADAPLSGGVLADTVLARLTALFPTAADPVRAEREYTYMKGVSPFLGIPARERRALGREVLRGTTPPHEEDCAEIALRCWELPEREYQYFAIDYLRRNVRRCSSAFLPTARQLITTKPWWDTVDHLAAHVVGPLVAADPALAREMDRWIGDDDLWVARTALLHQIRRGDAADEDRLFRYCLRQAPHPDFFIRKAIGWALREHGKTHPDAVRDFVAAHREELSPLSVREALKNL